MIKMRYFCIMFKCNHPKFEIYTRMMLSTFVCHMHATIGGGLGHPLFKPCLKHFRFQNNYFPWE